MKIYFDFIYHAVDVRLLLCLFQVAKLSTGDSLDMTQQDESSITANDATVKDMEVTSLIGLFFCSSIGDDLNTYLLNNTLFHRRNPLHKPQVL